jgi:hypothetical protein
VKYIANADLKSISRTNPLIPLSTSSILSCIHAAKALVAHLVVRHGAHAVGSNDVAFQGGSGSALSLVRMGNVVDALA